MSFVLALIAATIVQTRVSISSQPSGATVFIDGENRGQTPVMLFDLKPGRHNLKYRLHGYVDYDDVFSTTEGPVIDRNAMLEEERGLLLLKTDPIGCQIKIDGVSIGETPRFVGNLTTRDQHTVILSKLGYQSKTISVKFSGREPIVREETLVLDSGVVNILSDPVGAEVTINGIARGKTPLLVRDIPKGTTSVKLTLPGFKDEMRELKLSPGDQQTLSVGMTGLPGTLHLISIPDHASFYLNDEARGAAPLAIAGLTPGEYVVRCEAPGYASVTRTVKIDNGKSVREEFKLSNIMGRVEFRTVPAGAEVLLDGRRHGETKGEVGADFSNTFSIENIAAGEHTLIVRKDGYQEVSRLITIEPTETLRLNRLQLKKLFRPDVEIVTVNGTFRGVFKSQSENVIVIETKPGVEYPISRQLVRDIKPL